MAFAGTRVRECVTWEMNRRYERDRTQISGKREDFRQDIGNSGRERFVDYITRQRVSRENEDGAVERTGGDMVQSVGLRRYPHGGDGDAGDGAGDVAMGGRVPRGDDGAG